MWYINNLTNIVINYIANHRSKMQKSEWQLPPFPFSCASISESLLASATGQSPVKEVCEHIAAFFVRAATCFTFPFSRRCRASRRVSSLANLDNRHRLTIARGKAEREDGGSARDWSRRFNGTDSQGKVSRSIVPALVSFINVIPVYEMRGALVFTWFPF